MIILLMLPFLFGGFNQKWFIPRGISDGAAGRICIGDTDRDGNFEFIFTTYGGSFTIYFYELHLPNTWEVDSFPYVNSPLLWDIGDFDLVFAHECLASAYKILGHTIKMSFHLELGYKAIEQVSKKEDKEYCKSELDNIKK